MIWYFALFLNLLIPSAMVSFGKAMRNRWSPNKIRYSLGKTYSTCGEIIGFGSAAPLIYARYFTEYFMRITIGLSIAQIIILAIVTFYINREIKNGQKLN